MYSKNSAELNEKQLCAGVSSKMKVQAAWINQFFRFTFYSAQVFSNEICVIFKKTFWEHQQFHRPFALVKSVICKLLILWLYHIIVIWEFYLVCDDFSMTVKFIILIPFSKESMKVKKVSNLNLLDTCATVIHVSRTK